MPDTKAGSYWPVSIVISLVLLGGPALAHGEEGEAEAVDLVEQALAIVVNSPDAMSEAQERIEAALAADPAELEELGIDALGPCRDRRRGCP